MASVLSMDEIVTQHALVDDLASSAPACNGHVVPPRPQSDASAETKTKATKAKATKAKRGRPLTTTKCGTCRGCRGKRKCVAAAAKVGPSALGARADGGLRSLVGRRAPCGPARAPGRRQAHAPALTSPPCACARVSPGAPAPQTQDLGGTCPAGGRVGLQAPAGAARQAEGPRLQPTPVRRPGPGRDALRQGARAPAARRERCTRRAVSSCARTGEEAGRRGRRCTSQGRHTPGHVEVRPPTQPPPASRAWLSQPPPRSPQPPAPPMNPLPRADKLTRA